MEGGGTGPAADVFAKFAPVREWVRDLRLDTVIVIYNDHASAFSLELLPTFAIGAAESYAQQGTRAGHINSKFDRSPPGARSGRTWRRCIPPTTSRSPTLPPGSSPSRIAHEARGDLDLARWGSTSGSRISPWSNNVANAS
jgi:hypothetical protein